MARKKFNRILSTPFKCDQCGKQLSTKTVLGRHLATHLKDGDRLKFKCSVDQCLKKYTTKGSLDLHVQKVHSKTFKKLGCTFCDSTFMTKQSRNNHIVGAHTGEKAFPCKKCPARFSSAGLLHGHQIAHTDERPHNCSKCSKQFKTNSGLSFHMKTVHCKMRNFPCYFCKKIFTHQSYVEQHMRLHTQEKPYICDLDSCQFSCSDSSSFAKHTKRHQKVQPRSRTWSCYFCSKNISTLHSLENHFRLHTLEEPFSCGLCQKSYKNFLNLKCHISSHTKERPFKCEECQQCFFEKAALQKHIGAIHRLERQFFCEFCDYSAYQKCALNRHYLKHKSNTLKI